MKKLIIAATVVCVAALSQAAAVSWASGSITQADSKGKFTTTALSSGSGALYRIDKDFYDTWMVTLTAATTLEAQQTAMSNLKTALAGKSSIADASLYKGAITLKDPTDISLASGTNPIDLYAAMIYTYTDANDKEWFIADVGNYTAVANSNKSAPDLGMVFGGAKGTTAIQGWATASAVPEPTSGLLLLLGVAGLALRRRRA